MKRSREFFLWGFFLALCFWAGYLKGYLPLSMKQRIFVQGSFQILNAAPFDFPKPFLAALEDEIGQKIEVRRVRNWDELQAQLVTKNGPNLLFAPAQWTDDLSREGLVSRLNPIQPLIEKNISPDFISLQGKNLHILPLFWTITDFRVPASSFKDQDTIESILENKALAEVHLYPDIDLMVSHLQTWAKAHETKPAFNPSLASVGGAGNGFSFHDEADTKKAEATPATTPKKEKAANKITKVEPGLKLKDIEGFNFKNIPTAFRPNSLWEVPQSVDIPDTRSVKSARGQALMIYGMMIPRNSANRKMSYRSLERLMDGRLAEIALKELPLGTTLLDPDNELKVTKKQRSAELREFRLPDLIVLEKRNPEGFQELLPKYNFVF